MSNLFELAERKRLKNLERKTRALANKGINYVPRFDGDVLTDAKAAEKSEVPEYVEPIVEPVAPQLPQGESVGVFLASAPVAPTAPATGREGEMRISVVMRGASHTCTFSIPGIAGQISHAPDDLRRRLMAALQTQFGKRIENVNDVS